MMVTSNFIVVYLSISWVY